MFSERTTTSSNRTFKHWYTKPFVQPLMTSEPLGWDDINLYTSRLETSGDSEVSPLCGDHFLIFVVDGATRTEGRANGKSVTGYFTPGSIQLHPAWTESEARWESPVTMALIQLSSSLITQLAESAFRGDPAHVQLSPDFNFHDPLLHYLLGELCSEIQSPGPFGAVFAESASQTIMLHLLRKYSNATITLHPVRAKLTEQQLRVVNDYIESKLDQKISLTELARLLFMSQSHFERLFRASIGYAPYHYVLERKMERAKRLLSRTGIPLHQVAEQCGFANQSHFTRHFTHQVGISPARFRERFQD